jgi:MFS family permease
VNRKATGVQRTYLLLTLLSTLAASLIWGVNTLFLLDAGLNNTQAFAANAFFTAGQVIFEVPTGVLADTWGRRRSYLLGAGTLLVATLLYLLMWRAHAPLLGWAVASALIGLGFTFFSGATEAWLVDALTASGFDGPLESVFARGQIVSGAAMLVGSVSGGLIAQWTNLGAPYIVRSVLLGLTLLAAVGLMKDIGFTPTRGKGPLAEVRRVLQASIDNGWRNPPVRWLMLSAPFSMGVLVYAFYALQPYLLELYADTGAYWVAGLAAAIIAGTGILGGLLASRIRHLFARRTHALMATTTATVISLAILGLTPSFPAAIAVVVLWGMAFAASTPVRQAYLNGVISSSHRATVLSFDNLMSSAGGVVAQPALGRLADVSGYARSYLMCAVIQVAALPFLALARRENAASDPIEPVSPGPGAEPVSPTPEGR